MAEFFKAPRIASVLLVLAISAAPIASVTAEPATVTTPPMRGSLLARNPLTLVYLGMLLSACRANTAKAGAEEKACCPRFYLSQAGDLDTPSPVAR
jgi:hypothetical protein